MDWVGLDAPHAPLLWAPLWGANKYSQKTIILVVLHTWVVREQWLEEKAGGGGVGWQEGSCTLKSQLLQITLWPVMACSPVNNHLLALSTRSHFRFQGSDMEQQLVQFKTPHIHYSEFWIPWNVWFCVASFDHGFFWKTPTFLGNDGYNDWWCGWRRGWFWVYGSRYGMTYGREGGGRLVTGVLCHQTFYLSPRWISLSLSVCLSWQARERESDAKWSQIYELRKVSKYLYKLQGQDIHKSVKNHKIEFPKIINLPCSFDK